MFMGEFEHAIDSKGRLIIPAKFREQLGETFVITRGMDGCLFGYPMAKWEILQKRLAALPLNKRDARALCAFSTLPQLSVPLINRGGSTYLNHCSPTLKFKNSASSLGCPNGSKFGVRNVGTPLRTKLKRISMTLLRT